MPLRKDQDRSQWPRWVRIGLWGIKTRRAATFGWIVIAFSVFGWVLLLASSIPDWVWLVSEGIQVGFLAYWIGYYVVSAPLMFLSALWYWAGLRWVDRHDQ
jgi:hypothetical protein